VTGHSSGEIAAAYACDAISARQAIITAFYRGQVAKQLAKIKPPRGAMAAVGLGRDKALPFLVPGVIIACENSPNSVTLSGDKDALDEVVDRLKLERPDLFVQPLRVELAYHSRMFRRPV
jgi:acyl transferase domain-containing protein